MRFLLDMPVSPALIEMLAGYGHQATHAYQIGLGSAADVDLLTLARDEARVVISPPI